MAVSQPQSMFIKGNIIPTELLILNLNLGPSFELILPIDNPLQLSSRYIHDECIFQVAVLNASVRRSFLF